MSANSPMTLEIVHTVMFGLIVLADSHCKLVVMTVVAMAVDDKIIVLIKIMSPCVGGSKKLHAL